MENTQVLPGAQELPERLGKCLGARGLQELRPRCILELTKMFMEGAWWGWKFPSSLFPRAGCSFPALEEEKERGNVIRNQFGSTPLCVCGLHDLKRSFFSEDKQTAAWPQEEEEEDEMMIFMCQE